MPKSMTVKEFKQAIKSLKSVADKVSDTREAALLGELNAGMYADLSVAESMLSGAIESLEFQAERLEEEDARGADFIVDVL